MAALPAARLFVASRRRAAALRNLPITPTRAVVEYAERAQAQAAQAAIASAASEPAEIVVATAPVAPPPASEPARAVVVPEAVIAPPATQPAPVAAASELVPCRRRRRSPPDCRRERARDAGRAGRQRRHAGCDRRAANRRRAGHQA